MQHTNHATHHVYNLVSVQQTPTHHTTQHTKSSHHTTGPAHPDGLRLESRRIENGLEARITISSKYNAFPGIINGGILSTLMDCHGNWTAAIALMDKSCLPKPPLTLTASMLVRGLHAAIAIAQADGGLNM